MLVTKPMKRRELAKRLRAAGFTSRQGKGDHEVWTAPGFARNVVLTQTRDISPGLTDKALKAIKEKEEGE